MLERLKQYPLIGLAVAIASGFVLAHLLIKTGDNLYENNPDLLVNLAIAAAVLSLLVWQRVLILRWFGCHWRKVGLGVVSIAALYCLLLAVSMLRHPGWYN
jgi:hypothetical protein